MPDASAAGVPKRVGSSCCSRWFHSVMSTRDDAAADDAPPAKVESDLYGGVVGGLDQAGRLLPVPDAPRKRLGR